MTMDRAQPLAGAREKGKRRHEHHREAEVHGGEAAADQSHVVIERQPAHEHVGARGARAFAHGAHVGEQVGVRQHHALGLAGAARGVLQETDLPRRAAHRLETLAVPRDVAGHQHGAQRFHLRAQEPRDRLRLRDRHHDGGVRALQDANVPRQVVLDGGEPRRRVERHRNAAREQRAVEAVEVFLRRGQHDRHRSARQESRFD